MPPLTEADRLYAGLAAPPQGPTGLVSPGDPARADGPAEPPTSLETGRGRYEPTAAELEHLARDWAGQALHARLEPFLYGQTSSAGWRRMCEAREHLARLEAVLGAPATRAAWRDVEDDARRAMGEATWRVWTSGSPAERARVADEAYQAWDYLDTKVADVATQARAVEYLRANPCGCYLDGAGDLWSWSWAGVPERDEAGQLVLQVRTARGARGRVPAHRLPTPAGWYAPFGLR